jgi:hypothetical protein
MLSRPQIANQQERERVLARKREEEDEEAARRQGEKSVISTLHLELRALRATDPGMDMLTGWNSSPPTRAAGLLSIDIVVVTTATSDRVARVMTVS